MDHELYNLLLDYYGQMLTKHQLDILKDYFYEDLSMNEIAENRKISKAAVSDVIKRSTKQLKDYETKLHIIKDTDKINSVLDEMDKSSNYDIKKYSNRIRKIVRG